LAAGGVRHSRASAEDIIRGLTARAERFQREMATLFARHEDLLDKHRLAPFSQSDYLKKFKPDMPSAT